VTRDEIAAVMAVIAIASESASSAYNASAPVAVIAPVMADTVQRGRGPRSLRSVRGLSRWLSMPSLMANLVKEKDVLAIEGYKKVPRLLRWPDLLRRHQRFHAAVFAPSSVFGDGL
jgi:hypothetical protein